MKTIITLAFALFVVSTFSVTAQQKLQKFNKTVNANNDVTINLNTSHTNIEVDTWNKNSIEVEAYIEGEKLSKEELERELKNWDITVNGTGDVVTIESKSTGNSWASSHEDFNKESLALLKHLRYELADLPAMPEIPEFPQLPELPRQPGFPQMPEMPKIPELPELPQGIGAVNFDYDAYKKDGEAYLDKWSKEYEAKFGKEYNEKMKAWGRKFGKTDFEAYSKEMEAWGEKFGKEYGEAFGKDYESKMEEWGNKFDEKWGKAFKERMETWGKGVEEQAKAMEERQAAMGERHADMREREAAFAERRESIAKRIDEKVNTKVKKTIKIKMPKKAKLKMNVRHGELKFASVISDMRGNISHSALTANSIDGSKTSINVSYSPVLITNWILGDLKLNYVEKAQIANVDRLVLSSNSSNIDINSLMGNAVIDGSFGELSINNILPSFNNLNILLENSEAFVVLPKTAYNLQYKGSRSKLKHPKNNNSSTTTFSSGDLISGKTIVINAKFSEVTMQ